MKILVSLSLLCFALNSGMGAPANGRYMFVKCNPRGSDANCQTHRSQEMKLSADLPDKLPASATQYIDAELVREKEDGPVTEQEQPEGDTAMFLSDDGSGGLEGSATGMADGSGEYWTEAETLKAGDEKAEYQPAEEELKEDHLLTL